MVLLDKFILFSSYLPMLEVYFLKGPNGKYSQQIPNWLTGKIVIPYQSPNP
jgi:hypothetical protein